MSNLSPIGLSAYHRLEHVKKTVQALKHNFLAPESELFIFSDAPKSGDEEKVYMVREYLKTINGFKNVTVVERTNNSRVKNNRGGIKFLLEEYGKIIFLEEDILTSPNFLTFMNRALDFYKDDDRIISISGYSPPIIISNNYTKDIYLSYRFSAWGFGVWKDRYDMIDFNLNGIKDFFLNNLGLREFCRGGEDMLPMLLYESEGELDALDVKFFYTQYKKNMYTIYPKESLVQNIGFDGSGLHCGESNKFNTEVDRNKRVHFFERNIEIDPHIMAANFQFRKIPFKHKIKLILTKRPLRSVLIRTLISDLFFKRSMMLS